MQGDVLLWPDGRALLDLQVVTYAAHVLGGTSGEFSDTVFPLSSFVTLPYSNDFCLGGVPSTSGHTSRVSLFWDGVLSLISPSPFVVIVHT